MGDRRPQGPRERELAYHLHRLLAGPEPARNTDTIHASEVTTEDGWCPRHWAILDMRGRRRPRSRRGSTAERLVWKQGRMLATAIIGYFRELGMAVGDWECIACGSGYRFQKAPEACACGSSAFRYKEVRFTSRDSGISGGIDLLLDLPGEELLLPVELKTLDKERFKELSGPLAEALARTRLYLRLVAESRHKRRREVNQEEAVVLYISKGGWGARSSKPRDWGLRDRNFSPFKEFRVARDDAAVEDPYCAKARALYRWRQRKAGFPAGICQSSICDRAAACEVVHECFSGAYAPGKEVYPK